MAWESKENEQVFAWGEKVYELEAVGRNNEQGTIVGFRPDAT